MKASPPDSKKPMPVPLNTPAHLQPDTPPAPHPDACFDADWLALRRAADRAARASALESLAAEWLCQRQVNGVHGQPLRIVDLGSGSGANPCHLAPRLPGPQQWLLIDHDATLLATALDACTALHDRTGGAASVRAHRADLGELDARTLAGADLVCASALLDLVEATWLDRLADACASAGSALLVTLSVDGSWRFVPEVATTAAPSPIDAGDDDFVRAAFNDHQRRDKGLGPALGPDAAPTLAARLEAGSFRVHLAPSLWRLTLAEPAQAALARALIDGWRDAACAQRPDSRTRIEAWHARRRADCDQGGDTLEVGHIDLFATPARAS